MKKIKKKYLLNRSILKCLDKTSTSHKKKTKNEVKENESVDTLMHIFKKLLDDIYFYREKLLTDGDDEDLHQLRIACRRSVVLMGEFRLLYEKERLLEHRTGLKNLISISNTKRDMDVLISKLDKIDEETHNQDALDALKEYVEKILQIEHETIIDYLESEACINVLMAWKNYIADMNRTNISIYGRYPIELLSKYVIFQRFLKIKKRIKKLDPKHDASETLHKLRIEYKKMRYLLESFGYLYEKKEIKKLLKEMKKLQDILGDFHDAQQQKILFDELLESQKDEKVCAFITEVLISRVKAYQKKEISTIQKHLDRFLKREKAYRKLFT